MEIILVLGSPNADDGTLSKMAESRLAECLNLYRNRNSKIVLTGGFGEHFNITKNAHALYLKQSLIESGVKNEDILALIESSNSVQDAILSKWIIDKFQPEQIVIVTSDYHYLRAKLIFETVYAPFKNFRFQLASSKDADETIISNLIDHEKTALQGLIDFGVRF
jgi:hypothetical protein